MAPLKKVETLSMKAQRTLLQLIDSTLNIHNNDDYNHSDDSLKQYFDCIPSAINDDIFDQIMRYSKFDGPNGQRIALVFSNVSSQNVRFTGVLGENTGI